MQFGKYLHEKKFTVAKAAKALGMTHERVRRYARGERIPDRDAMPKIVEWTGGAVTADDFYEISDAKKSGKKREAA